MQDNFPKHDHEDSLRTENDFLKMKLMLEHGGSFGGNNEELPPEIEHQFLSNIMAFEEQFAKQKTISVFEKLGRPQQFKSVSEIADPDIDSEWDSLKACMLDHGIALEACNPAVTTRELYRFTIEELFQKETNDINLPGWTTNFIYDEFHPDPFYENSVMVEEHLFPDIFSKTPLFNKAYCSMDGLRFNGQFYQDADVLEKKLARLKSVFDDIELRECDVQHCEIKDNKCRVKGKYHAIGLAGANEVVFSGQFIIDLNEMDGYWFYNSIEIEGLRLE